MSEENKPVVYRFAKRYEFNEFVSRFRKGEKVECDSAMLKYWLNVLPPRWMNQSLRVQGVLRWCDFGFGEGDDITLAFWNEGEDGDGNPRHFAQLVTHPDNKEAE